MEKFEFTWFDNSEYVIKLYENITGMEYMIPDAYYFYYTKQVFLIPKNKGKIKKVTQLKVYENWLKLTNEEKQPYKDIQNKLSLLYNKQIYKISDDPLKPLNFIRISNEICQVINKNLKKDVCMKCWLRKYMCICEKIKKVNLSHKIYLIFHYSEILKCSNTGKLLKLMDDKTEILIFGIEEYEEKIKKLFSDNEFVKKSVCLFPSNDSIYASEYINKKGELNNICDGMKNMSIGELNIFVIDGTWPQAISMMLLVPKEMVKLKIIAKTTNIYNKLRYRFSEDTCCTLEAVAILLTDLGETKENVQEMYNSLVMLVDINLINKKEKLNIL